MLEDPPCLLTGSRDRSVKLRALPTKGQHQGNSRPAQADRVGTSSSEHAEREAEENNPSKCHSEKNIDIVPASTSPMPPTSPAYAAAGAQEREPQQQQDRSSADKRQIVDKNGPLLPSTAATTAVAAPAPIPSSPSSKSTRSTTSSSTGAKILQHGHHLSTLTLGRIEDGFRRDKYVFPVDLQGRGEGRAVEARAVLQVRFGHRFLTQAIVCARDALQSNLGSPLL